MLLPPSHDLHYDLLLTLIRTVHDPHSLVPNRYRTVPNLRNCSPEYILIISYQV